MEDRGLNSDGDVKSLRARAVTANLPIKEITPNVIPGYVGKPKGALQIAAERGFIDIDGILTNGNKYSMNGTSFKDPATKVVTIDKTTRFLEF